MTKVQVAATAESDWPVSIQVIYDNGNIKIRQQSPVIKALIAETTSRCEEHMVTVDAFPERGRRAEFRFNIAKEAIRDLSKRLKTDPEYEEAYRHAKLDPKFVRKIGELVCPPLSLCIFN